MDCQEIIIDKKTQKIIKKINKLSKKTIILPELTNNSRITRANLIHWIKEKKSVEEKERFLLESLSAALLSDLNNSLSSNSKSTLKKNSPNWKTKLKFLVLIIAGLIFCACEGFDGISAILSITSLPLVITVSIGLIFSFLSIAMFLFLDLMAISESLEINLKYAPQIIDTYYQEITTINAIRKEINVTFSKKNINEVEQDIELLNALIEKYKQLNHSCKSLKAALNNPKLKIAKLITTGISGIIFFSGGFYAGQTVAFAIAAMLGMTLGATAPMIIIPSILVGIAALIIYWCVERPGVESLVARFLGLDEEKIERLTSDDRVQNDLNKLMTLKESLTLRVNDLTLIHTQKKEIKNLTEKWDPTRTNSSLNFYSPRLEPLEDAGNDSSLSSSCLKQ